MDLGFCLVFLNFEGEFIGFGSFIFGKFFGCWWCLLVYGSWCVIV